MSMFVKVGTDYLKTLSIIIIIPQCSKLTRKTICKKGGGKSVPRAPVSQLTSNQLTSNKIRTVFSPNIYQLVTQKLLTYLFHSKKYIWLEIILTDRYSIILSVLKNIKPHHIYTVQIGAILSVIFACVSWLSEFEGGIKTRR